MNDRLLIDDEINIIFKERQKIDPLYAEDWSVYIAKAQDAKTSKWWIEKIEKLGRCEGECWDGGFVIIVNGLDWQALKKQIGVNDEGLCETPKQDRK